jgi:hypothetical protein
MVKACDSGYVPYDGKSLEGAGTHSVESLSQRLLKAFVKECEENK